MLRKLPALAVAVLSLIVTAEASAAGYATRTLRVGSSGSDVRAFQRYLDRAGYDTSADGAFGPATRRSVMAFEQAEGRRANGVASRAEQRLVRAKASRRRRRQRRGAGRAGAREGLRRLERPRRGARRRRPTR